MALWNLKRDPRYRVVGLLTTVNTRYRRIVMHGVRESVLDAQAAALGIPLFKLWLPERPDNSAYEAVMRDAMTAWKARGVQHVAFGDLFLSDVREYRETQLAKAGMQGIFPIWGWNTANMAREFIHRGFRARLACVDGEKLGAHFAGRDFDSALLADLANLAGLPGIDPSGIDPCGENGEFHTCVEAGPIFETPLELRPGQRVTRDNRFHYCDLEIVP